MAHSAQNGISLYRFDQTAEYHPRPETIASQQYYDFFVADQHRHKLSQWNTGHSDYEPDKEPGWRTFPNYLSRDKVRQHLQGKEAYACWGDFVSRWFAPDIDYHGGDPNLFLKLLLILQDLPNFLPHVRWLYILNRQCITGIHLVGLLPESRLLYDLERDVRKVLAYLENEHLAELLPFKPSATAPDDFHPLTALEFYPATNHAFRLPYACDRLTITDEWLNRPGEVDLKPNLIKFMDYVQDKERQALPLTEVIAYVTSEIKWQQPKKTASRTRKRRKRSNGGSGMGKIEPLKGRHLQFITGVLLGTEDMPPDTIGSWGAPALRHLMLVDGLDKEEALAKLEEYYEAIPDPSFSDRISNGDTSELLRTDAYTAAKIESGNLYQPQPEQSTEIFSRVKRYCQLIGFVFADRSTWHVLNTHRPFNFDISQVDFSLTFEEQLCIKEPGAALLKCDIPSAYQAAHRIKAYIIKYPDYELPATLVPHLCAGLPISWYIKSDEEKRCKKAEKFLALLRQLGIITIIRRKEWHGDRSSLNRAATYGISQDEAYNQSRINFRGIPLDDAITKLVQGSFERIAQTEAEDPVVADLQTMTEKPFSDISSTREMCIYVTDFSGFSAHEMKDFALENQRLNRVQEPEYHNSG
jgi:hypothetical protein